MSSNQEHQYLEQIISNIKILAVDTIAKLGTVAKSLEECSETSVNEIFNEMKGWLKEAGDKISDAERSFGEYLERKSSAKNNVNENKEEAVVASSCVAGGDEEKRLEKGILKVAKRDGSPELFSEEDDDNTGNVPTENNADVAQKNRTDEESVGNCDEKLNPEAIENENSVDDKNEDTKPKIGSIKVVDIRNLLDPCVVSKSRDSSVIILSDSDSETKKKKKTKKKEKRPVRQVAQKKQVSFRLPTSDSSDDDYETTRRITRKTGENKKVLRSHRKTKEDKEVDSGDGDAENHKSQTKKRKVRRLQVEEQKESEIVCTKRVVIPLPRIPCEQLKEYYLEGNKKLSEESKSMSKKRVLDDVENDEVTNQVKKLKTDQAVTSLSGDAELLLPENHVMSDAKKTSQITSETDSDKESDADISGARKVKRRLSKQSKNTYKSDSDSSTDCAEKNNGNATTRKLTEKHDKHAKSKTVNQEISATTSNKESDTDQNLNANSSVQENRGAYTEGADDEDESETEDRSLDHKIPNISQTSESNENIALPSANDDETKIASESDDDTIKVTATATANEEKSDSDTDTSLIGSKKPRRAQLRKNAVLSSDSESEKEKTTDAKENERVDRSEPESDAEKKEEEEDKGKKRRRIRKIAESSSDEAESSKGKDSRKHIRKVLKDDSLKETTKRAEREENERKARIMEKQKKYNQIYEMDLSSKAVVDKVVLDFDDDTKEELLRVDDDMVKVLKPHQASGIQFMWDACFESLKRSKDHTGSGCILAHCMGLGKTLQVITLSHTLLMNSEQTGVKKIMVVCPLNTVLNWVAEFKQWLPESSLDDIEIYDIASQKQNSVREYVVSDWHKNGGVLIIGYDMFRNLSNIQNKRMPKRMRAKFHTALVDPGPDLVICDEGHLLKNEKTSISIAMNQLKTLRRIVLTGTPLQNNLKEYYCMIQFVKPNLLGTYREYLNRFVNPITNGQYTDSTPFDIQLMRKRSHVLHKMLDGVVQRRDYSVLQPYLPPKHEYVLFLSLTETQIKLYSYYLENFARKPIEDVGKVRPVSLFADFQELQRICTHPRVLLDKSIEVKNAKEKFDDEESEGSLKDFIDDGDDEKETSNDSDSSSANSDSSKSDKASTNQGRVRITRSNAALAGGIEEINKQLDEEHDVEPEWWEQLCPENAVDDIKMSGKLLLLFEILKQCEAIGDKLLVFSQSLYSLNVIEYFLRKVDEATQNGDTESIGYSGSWALGLDYFRLDGSSSCDNRSAWCKSFNDPENVRARLFLISTRAGGLGINLCAANRVIIFDVSWNPSHDIQSVYRVYRFGQTKPCYIYRFVTLGTMEMKIYERQVTKQAISKRVIDEQQIDRHYTQNDLSELYKFEPNPPEGRPIPLVPKDVLLGELLQDFPELIHKYHEHQSLLENKEDEVLNEEERKAAWEEFENEKNRRQDYGQGLTLKGAFHGIPMHTALMAVCNILRRENPNCTMQYINQVAPTYMQQVSEQIRQNNTAAFAQIIEEVRNIQIEQQRKFKEIRQQQELMQMQQRQQLQQRQMDMAANYSQLYNMIRNGMAPNFSQVSGAPQPNRPLNTNEIIELND